MERVVQLLQQQNFRQALLRLWVLGTDAQRLNEWEQVRGSAMSQIAAKAKFLRDIATEAVITVEDAQTATLALIQALDEFVAEHRARDQPTARRRNKIPPMRESGKDWWLVPVISDARRNVSLNRQVGNLGTWFHHHAVLPATTASGLSVELAFTQSTTDDALERLWSADKPSLKVWIGHFNDKADVVWDRSLSQAGDWRTQSVAPHEYRLASLLAAISAATDAHAHVAVFPEFTIDLEQRRHLIEHLRSTDSSSLVLVVAGSFHEPEGVTAFNSAPVYDARGRAVLTHRKLRIFGDIEHGAEHVSLGKSIQVLVTPIGCMTVLICKDFIDSHPSVEGLLTEVPVDWVLVPSYGDEKTIRLHKDKAQKLAKVKTGTHTVVAQTLNTAGSGARVPAECVRGFGFSANKSESPKSLEDICQVGETGGLVEFSLNLQFVPKPPASSS